MILVRKRENKRKLSINRLLLSEEPRIHVLVLLISKLKKLQNKAETTKRDFFLIKLS